MSETIYENQVLLGTFTGGTTTSNVQVFTTPGTWIRPSNFTVVRFEAWGAGGGGGYANSGAGGGGAYVEYWWDPISSSTKFPITGPLPITVGAGGTGSDTPGASVPGGNSIVSFGTSAITAYGGGGGAPSVPGALSGGGGGVMTAGTSGPGGGGNGGGGGGSSPEGLAGSGIIYGGGGGAYLGGGPGGYSIYGGGGGSGTGVNLRGPGLSVFGGSGGQFNPVASPIRNGGLPGGGGAAADTGTGKSGDGGGGLVRITTY